MTLQILPRELIGESINHLDTKDAIQFGKTNKQFQQDLSKCDFGYHVIRHPTQVNVVFDLNNKILELDN